MRTWRGGAFLVLMLLGGAGCFVPRASGREQTAGSIRTKVEGVWRGHSVCEDKSSACRDEVNVYRFAGVAGKPGAFVVTASKVVDGKEIVMGSSEWKYDEKGNAVESQTPAIRLVIDGKKMEGALRLEDGTVYRRIYLQRDN